MEVLYTWDLPEYHQTLESAIATFESDLVNYWTSLKIKPEGWEWGFSDQGQGDAIVLRLYMTNGQTKNMPIYWVNQNHEPIRGLSRGERIRFEVPLRGIVPDPRAWSPRKKRKS